MFYRLQIAARMTFAIAARKVGLGGRMGLVWPTGLVVVALLVALAGGRGAAAESSAVGEYELKAAFLPKFPLFVRWPAAAFPASGTPLIIGVLGENPFGRHLEEAVGGKIVDGHPLKVQLCRDAQEAGHCQIVFISGADPKALAGSLSQLTGNKVLTVGDAPGFASQGGMVNLITINQKVRLEVNLEAIQSAGLRMDPQFLQIAKVVKTAPPNAKP